MNKKMENFLQDFRELLKKHNLEIKSCASYNSRNGIRESNTIVLRSKTKEITESSVYEDLESVIKRML